MTEFNEKVTLLNNYLLYWIMKSNMNKSKRVNISESTLIILRKLLAEISELGDASHES